MTALINFDLSWYYEVDIREVKKIRKQDEMQKCYETSPVGKSKEAPLKGRKKG